jgi:glutaminase
MINTLQVGLPAKSGVCGAMLVVIPNVMGICVWSPPLDSLGNSCRGVQFCEVSFLYVLIV